MTKHVYDNIEDSTETREGRCHWLFHTTSGKKTMIVIAGVLVNMAIVTTFAVLITIAAKDRNVNTEYNIVVESIGPMQVYVRNNTVMISNEWSIDIPEYKNLTARELRHKPIEDVEYGNMTLTTDGHIVTSGVVQVPALTLLFEYTL